MDQLFEIFAQLEQYKPNEYYLINLIIFIKLCEAACCG